MGTFFFSMSKALASNALVLKARNRTCGVFRTRSKVTLKLTRHVKCVANFVAKHASSVIHIQTRRLGMSILLVKIGGGMRTITTTLRGCHLY